MAEPPPKSRLFHAIVVAGSLAGCAMTHAGDGGTDAGEDAGTDAGVDSGVDAGPPVDAGPCPHGEEWILCCSPRDFTGIYDCCRESPTFRPECESCHLDYGCI